MKAHTPLLLGIDQGTSATKAILVDPSGTIIARANVAVGETRPQPGWVEQDPEEIWRSVQAAVSRCVAGHDVNAIRAVGLSVQRESALLWERETGRPVAPLLSWQDRRTVALCDGLRTHAIEKLVVSKSGLPLDPMFSACKMSWLLNQYDPDRALSKAGKLCLGTVDSWLLFKLSGVHRTEPGNASRTQLLNVWHVGWDDELLALFNIPREALPEIKPSSGPLALACGLSPLPETIPVMAVMGDSHAALFAHGIDQPEQVKATYGTGSSIMGLINHPEDLADGLCLTIGWQMEEVRWAAEGNIRASGATIRWVSDLLQRPVEEIAALAETSDSHGVVLVPGFNGLGAPWWDDKAVGLITNLSFTADAGALARAAFEAVVQQVADVVDAVKHRVHVKALFADGGPSQNPVLMQLQADLLGIPILCSQASDLSALGVVHMAGLAAGLWTKEEWLHLPRQHQTFHPRMDETTRQKLRTVWLEAVARGRFQPHKYKV